MSSRDTPPRGPPRPPFVVSVGVTGHRAKAIDEASAKALVSRIGEQLILIGRACETLLAEEPGYFADAPITWRLVSPIADGADQIAAQVALDLGWELQVLLPFERERYRSSLAGANSRKRFDELIKRATCVFELPGEGGRDIDSYVMTGRATVAHSDILLAVWDGLPSRGRGGTADVVQLALTHGTPVLHVPPDPNARPRLLWSAFDPHVLTAGDEPEVERPADLSNLSSMLKHMMLPPDDRDEREFLAGFQRERLRKIRTRIEYPLMLALAGVNRFGAKDFRASHCERQIREEWLSFRTGCVDPHSIEAPIAMLEESYSWADQLATHFAQTYRSGHIFGFLLGSLAVCIGLSAFMAPQYKLEFASLELVVTVAVILNAWLGTRNEWHRRWLDYRQLAERLRPMRSLKLLGIAAPDPPGTQTNPVPRRWIEWYSGAIWRAVGCPSGVLDSDCASRLARAIADHEIAPQVAYHRRNAERVEKLDKRLEAVGLGLFIATLAVSLLTMEGMIVGARWVDTYGDWFTLISAGFPALGTAVFGIRFQADFGGDALRSLATAATLGRIDVEMRQNVSLNRAADLTEQAARVMLADLDEWRLVNQQRELEFG